MALQLEYDQVKEIVSKNGLEYRNLADEFKNNKKILLIAVNENGFALYFAPDHLKNDKEVVLTAMTNKPRAFKYASDTLQNDEEVVLFAVKRCGDMIEYASNNLKDNKEVIMEAVSNHGSALMCASPTLKNDKEVVMAAVTNEPMALFYASHAMRNDKEIVYTALSKNGNAFRYASEYLKDDKELALLAVSNSYYDHSDYELYNENLTFYYVSKSLKDDIDVIYKAIKNNGYVLYYLSNKLIMSNPKLIVYAIDKSGMGVLTCVPYDDSNVEKLYGRDDNDIYNVYEDNPGDFPGYLTNHGMWDHTYEYVYIHINENIQTYENFLVFLHGVSASRSQSITRKLKTHGPHHSINYLNLIAKFTGVIHSNDYYVYKNVFIKIRFFKQLFRQS
jgi:hypothetical protein